MAFCGSVATPSPAESPEGVDTAEELALERETPVLLGPEERPGMASCSINAGVIRLPIWSVIALTMTYSGNAFSQNSWELQIE